MLVPLSPQPVADDELARRKGLAAHRALRFKGTCTYNAVPAEDMAARRGRWKRPRREAEYARRHMRAEERGRREERGEREEDREDKVRESKREREREGERGSVPGQSVMHAILSITTQRPPPPPLSHQHTCCRCRSPRRPRWPQPRVRGPPSLRSGRARRSARRRPRSRRPRPRRARGGGVCVRRRSIPLRHGSSRGRAGEQRARRGCGSWQMWRRRREGRKDGKDEE